MDNDILVNAYIPPSFDRKEIFRYAGCKEGDTSLENLLEECIGECENAFSYRVCSRVFPLEEFICKFGPASKDLKKNLQGCEYAVCFAATIGLQIDRLMQKYAEISPVKAVLLQAIGAERIEALCDCFCEDLKKKGLERGFTIRPRFSSGYGDFPLEAQLEFFRVLDCVRKIGVSLTETLLMTPTKSVTAVVGLKRL